jgi:biopolymer transport protein ExbB
MKLSLNHFLLSAALLVSSVAVAQDMEAVASGANTELQQAMADLTQARQQVEAGRIPLAQKLTATEQELIDQRAALAKAQRFQENQLVELNALKREANDRSMEVKYIDSLLGEYARSLRSRLNFAEEPRYQAMFGAFDQAGGAADLSPADKFAQRSVLLTTSIERSESALGGESFEGTALDKSGLVQKGKVVLFGPVGMFAAESGGAAGLLQQELNKADPTIAQMDTALVEGCRKLVNSGAGDLPLDPTLGNAFKLSAIHKSLFEQIKDGGIVMIPLLGLGFSVVGLALFKWWQLSRVRLATAADLQKVLGHIEAREQDKALQLARGIPGFAGELLAAAIEHVDEKREYIEEILYEKMLGARTRLERGLPFLALAATTGPLLGLLGTVTGMIATFRIISGFGGGDPKMLAAGISEALVCTATGMAIAIPALLFHAILSRRAKGIIGSMEQTAVGFVNGVPEGEENPFLRATSTR